MCCPNRSSCSRSLLCHCCSSLLLLSLQLARLPPWVELHWRPWCLREESMHWKASLPADSSASRASHPAREGPSRTTHAQQAASRSGPVAQQSASSASADDCAIATPPRRQGSRLCGHPRRAVAMPAPAVAGSPRGAPPWWTLNRFAWPPRTRPVRRAQIESDARMHFWEISSEMEEA